MGEVYKARDTRLNRTVAIKVLPEDFSLDADRRQRFEREARLVASLSHPNICALHDVGTESSSSGESARAYIVMEFLEGETLEDRLARGPLPLPDIIRYGVGVATALHAAHRQHIVHRDLKPGNIMITRAGVKLLDFGLAKPADPMFAASDAHSTRVLTNVTMAGAVMGTVPYMAPEQLEGRPADWRSDIFALGAVLHEMATGKRAFNGSSQASIASAILTSDPPPIASSSALDRIVRVCLARDPDRRWQSAHDVALQLEGLQNRVDAEPPPISRGRASYLPWAIAAGALVVAAVALIWSASRSTAGTQGTGLPAAKVVMFPLPPPPGGSFTQSVEWNPVAVSPDGQRIAYSARSADGRVRLWLRTLGAVDGRPVEGTEGVSSMFWSPDGKSLAFFAFGKLKRFELSGGAPVAICDVREGIGQTGTWGADGQIVFASVQGEALLSVSASGGSPVEMRKRSLGGGERRLTWPTFLPDGRRLFYLLTASDDTGSVMLLSPDGSSREVLKVKSNVQYVDPGYLLYSSDATLVARRFDLATGAISGDPIVVGDHISYFRATGLAPFSASRTGVIAYQANQDESRMAIFDRTGRELAQVGTGGALHVRLSADERMLLFSRIDPRTSTFDIWTRDLDRGLETRITTDPATDVMANWAPDGTLIYSAVRGAAPRLFRRTLATGKDEELSPEGVGMQTATSVSPDGSSFLYSQRTDRGNYDLMIRRFSDNATTPFRTSPASEEDARFSPDGKLVAFVTDETGRGEVVVAPFPSGPTTPVSTTGGANPRWSSNGRELLYITPDGELMAVPVQPGPPVTIGKAARLSAARAPDGRWGEFEVMADGRLLAVVRTRVASQQPMTVIVDWPAALSR